MFIMHTTTGTVVLRFMSPGMITRILTIVPMRRRIMPITRMPITRMPIT